MFRKTLVKTVIMKNILSLLVFIAFFTSYAQVSFEPGIIIDKAGSATSCLIENKDWFFTPSSVRYKLNENSEIKTITASTVKSFQIGENVSYIAANIDVNASPTKDLNLDYFPEPTLRTKTIFLKELVSGAALLYQYRENLITQYFYKTADSDLTPLIYKRYYKQDEDDKGIRRIIENEDYKNVLFQNLKCDDISLSDVRSLRYDEKSLKRFFSDYNFCKTGVRNTENTSKSKGKFNLRAKVGAGFNQLDISFSPTGFDTDLRSIDLTNETSIRIGAEIEYVLGINKNKWALFFEPSYQSYKSEGVIVSQNTVTTTQVNASADYSVIEFPFGIRHYMYINDTSRLFLNGAFVISNDLSDVIDYSPDRFLDLEIRTQLTYYFGLGYDFNSTFSIEARYYVPREILGNFISTRGTFNSAGIILGYQFL